MTNKSINDEIKEELERYDLIGDCYAYDPSKIKQDILKKTSDRLGGLANMSLPRDVRDFAQALYRFYTDLTFFSWGEMTK